jgi:hypothetical protein
LANSVTLTIKAASSPPNHASSCPSSPTFCCKFALRSSSAPNASSSRSPTFEPLVSSDMFLPNLCPVWRCRSCLSFRRICHCEWICFSTFESHHVVRIGLGCGMRGRRQRQTYSTFLPAEYSDTLGSRGSMGTDVFDVEPTVGKW